MPRPTHVYIVVGAYCRRARLAPSQDGGGGIGRTHARYSHHRVKLENRDIQMHVARRLFMASLLRLQGVRDKVILGLEAVRGELRAFFQALHRLDRPRINASTRSPGWMPTSSWHDFGRFFAWPLTPSGLDSPPLPRLETSAGPWFVKGSTDAVPAVAQWRHARPNFSRTLVRPGLAGVGWGAVHDQVGELRLTDQDVVGQQRALGPSGALEWRSCATGPGISRPIGQHLPLSVVDGRLACNWPVVVRQDGSGSEVATGSQARCIPAPRDVHHRPGSPSSPPCWTTGLAQIHAANRFGTQCARHGVRVNFCERLPGSAGGTNPFSLVRLTGDHQCPSERTEPVVLLIR